MLTLTQVCHGCQLSEGDVEAIWMLTHIYDIWLFLLEKQTGGCFARDKASWLVVLPTAKYFCHSPADEVWILQVPVMLTLELCAMALC